MVPEKTSRQHVLSLAVLTEGGMAVVAIVLGWLLGTYPWQYIELSAAALGRGVLITIPMLAVFYCFVRWPIGPLARIKEFIDEVVRPLFKESTILDLVFITILAGVGEEMLFRGVIQPALVGWLGLWAGLLLASLLFGLAHPITFGYVVLAAVIGLYLGWLAHLFNSLTEVIVAHALYDFVALVYLLRFTEDPNPPSPELEESATEQAEQQVNAINTDPGDDQA